MKKIKTNLQYYKYNTSLQTSSASIIWYVLEVNGQNETGRCFSEDELQQFISFINANSYNFPNSHSILDCSSDENTPFCTPYLTTNQRPDNLILKNSPNIGGRINKCMDIILCDNRGNQNHNYNLGFMVIGVVQ